MNDLIRNIYKLLTDIGVVKSGNQFSREWLGRSDRLYSYILSSGRTPGLDIMLGLYVRLVNLCSVLISVGDNNNAKQVYNISTMLLSEMTEDCLTRKPYRRKKSAVDKSVSVVC